ncbi:VRR-NUC domain-containing protein [Staphylococcus aureus]|nr:VRR-NUC domain-containing protein [Staphylococcus aureus]
MKESTLEKYLVKEITKLNGLCLKWVAPGTRGVPDRIIIMPEGKTYFVEMNKKRESYILYKNMCIGNLKTEIIQCMCYGIKNK